MFVSTDCSTNERILGPGDLPYAYPAGQSRSQDPRYVMDAFGLNDMSAIEQPGIIDPDVSPPLTLLGQSKADVSHEACLRGCLCGYSQLSGVLPGLPYVDPLVPLKSRPYDACDCGDVLLLWYAGAFITDDIDYEDFRSTVITSANLSLLEFYGTIPCKSLGSSESTYVTSLDQNGLNFSFILTYNQGGNSSNKLNPFECFGDTRTIRDIMNNFTFAQISQSLAMDVNEDFNNSTCH